MEEIVDFKAVLLSQLREILKKKILEKEVN
jgi:hypothetical protein